MQFEFTEEADSMFQVYVLRSRKTARRYVGSCEDLDDRVRRHNAGESKATKHGVPWAVIHNERFSTRAEATRRERYYKTGRGRDELDRIEAAMKFPNAQCTSA
jgi:putative endonuclease